MTGFVCALPNPRDFSQQSAPTRQASRSTTFSAIDTYRAVDPPPLPASSLAVVSGGSAGAGGDGGRGEGGGGDD